VDSATTYPDMSGNLRGASDFTQISWQLSGKACHKEVAQYCVGETFCWIFESVPVFSSVQ